MRTPALRGRGASDQGRARVGGLLLFGLLLFGQLFACQTTADDTGDPTSDSGDDDGTVEYGIPQIISPGDDKIVVPINRTEPLLIMVAGVVPGVTQILIDERAVGTLSPATALGELREDSLRLELGGAMLVSRHTITLANPGPEEAQLSRTLQLSIEKRLPVEVSAIVESTLTEGHAITVDAAFEDALLTVVDEETDDGVAVAKIFRREGQGWAGTPRTVPLPGYARAPGETSPPVSASWANRTDAGGDADVLRVAWRVGLAGESIAGVEIDGSGSQVGELLTLMTSPAPFDGASGLALEWAGYGAPRFLGGELLVEMVALVDSESAHPGDHRLLQLRWPAPPAAPGQLFALATSELMDLEALGPAIDLLDRGQPVLALRAGGMAPALVRRTLAGQAEVTIGDAALGVSPGASVDLTAVISGFGAWSTAALTSKGEFAFSLLDTFSVMQGSLLSLEERPDALPSAALSSAVLGGFFSLAVPYGDSEVVHIATYGGNEIHFQPLEGLYCDAVALLIEDPSRSSGPLVCVYQGEVRLGTLTVRIE